MFISNLLFAHSFFRTGAPDRGVSCRKCANTCVFYSGFWLKHHQHRFWSQILFQCFVVNAKYEQKHCVSHWFLAETSAFCFNCSDQVEKGLEGIQKTTKYKTKKQKTTSQQQIQKNTKEQNT